jgi:hypothetical protein
MALNKGEWSEVYVFLKLLADGKLYAADENLNKIEAVYYPILSILREEASGSLTFARDTRIKVMDVHENVLVELDVRDFKEKSIELLEGIRNSDGGAFELPDILEFMHLIKISRLKAQSNDKRDITLVVHDIFMGANAKLGFSIKSRLGGASTLINASKSTNFIYRLSIPLSQEAVEAINAMSTKNKIQDRISQIHSRGSSLVYHRVQSETFEQNLTMIDSQFPNIISVVLELFYGGEGSSIPALVEKLNEINPCYFSRETEHPFYEYKIKNFLTDSALGMTPNTIWSGHYDANGGYIIVKENGEVLCYHIYNRNEFQDYLYANTKLETASSSRHGFGKIYTIDNEQFFNLNLQVRFR